MELETSRKLEVCPICKVGRIVPEAREKENIVLYTRNGPKMAAHRVFRCINKNDGNPCRTAFSHGYYSYLGHTIYEDDALEKEFLVTTDQTGFGVEYLIELAAKVQICHEPFEAEGKLYNHFYTRTLPYDVLMRRREVDRRRITHGWKLFTYLEAASCRSQSQVLQLLRSPLQQRKPGMMTSLC